MADETFTSEIRIFLTGFGQYRNFKANPSWQIVRKLPSSITHKGLAIKILQHHEPLKSEYHYLLDAVPKLIDDLQPHAIISLGQDELATDFKIERGARRDVYNEIPDMARKVLTKTEVRKIWPDGPEKAESKLNMEDLLRIWQSNLAKVKGEKMAPGLAISGDAGNYVCGMVYYTALEHLRRKADGSKAVFLHVPPLASPVELEEGARVTVALIKAVAESCEV